MSGHSKWHNIQGRKGKQDKAKSGLFTKYGKMITVAARMGGGDQNANFGLRLAIDKAKEINMPKDNIERAIKRGTGELNDGAALEEILYEGFGPGGVAIMVEVMTDNKNRTAGDVKHIFSLYGGNVGGPGSVQWQFQKLGVVRFGIGKAEAIAGKKDEFEMSVIDAGAEDIIESEFGTEIRMPVVSFQKVVETVKAFGIDPDDASLEWVAKDGVALDEAGRASLQSIIEKLEDHDDVRGVYTNEK